MLEIESLHFLMHSEFLTHSNGIVKGGDFLNNCTHCFTAVSLIITKHVLVPECLFALTNTALFLLLLFISGYRKT